MSELNRRSEYRAALGLPTGIEVEFVASGGLVTLPTGTFVHFDCGKLDLGLMRDSQLNRSNEFEIFLEMFE